MILGILDGAHRVFSVVCWYNIILQKKARAIDTLIRTLSRECSGFSMRLQFVEQHLARAMSIAESLDDLPCQVQILSNLSLVYSHSGDGHKAKEVLLKAKRIHNENHCGETFEAIALVTDGRIEHRRATEVSKIDTNKIVGHIGIPIGFSALFDQEPEKAVRNTRRLICQGGNIEGNLGALAFHAKEFDSSEFRYKNALEVFAEVNDGPRIAETLVNLARVAEHSNQIEAACGYWKDGIAVYEKLKKADSGEPNSERWDRAIRSLEVKVQDAEAGTHHH